jgi:thioesterase domain-containing protein
VAAPDHVSRTAGRQYWIRRLSRGGKAPPEPDLAVFLDLSRYLPDLYDLFRVLYAALLAYRPEHYRGRTVVFRAAAQPVFRLWDEPGLGWRELIEPEPIVRVVPGNHRTITAEPYVGALANQLRQCLDEADASL